jgi:hypothetical protein
VTAALVADAAQPSYAQAVAIARSEGTDQRPERKINFAAIATRVCLSLRRHPAGEFLNTFLQFLKGRSRSHRDFGLQLLE